MTPSHITRRRVTPSHITRRQFRHFIEADRIDDLMRAVWVHHQLGPHTLLRASSPEALRSLVGAGVTVLPDALSRPSTLDAEHVEVRRLPAAARP